MGEIIMMVGGIAVFMGVLDAVNGEDSLRAAAKKIGVGAVALLIGWVMHSANIVAF